MALGFAAGVSPGPLMSLVVNTALERGFSSGLKVALAPILTDAPIVLLSLFVVRRLPSAAVPWLSIAGGLFVLWIGWASMRGVRSASLSATGEASSHRDLLRGALVNALSPHPWLFWLSVGSPLLAAAWDRAPALALGFLAVFFGLLVGLKAIVAALVGEGRRFLSDRAYRIVLAVSAVVLLALGALLLVRGVAAF